MKTLESQMEDLQGGVATSNVNMQFSYNFMTQNTQCSVQLYEFYIQARMKTLESHMEDLQGSVAKILEKLSD